MKKLLFTFCLVMVILSFAVTAKATSIPLGDFDTWKQEGDVSAKANTADLGKNSTIGDAIISQTFSLIGITGSLNVSFDYQFCEAVDDPGAYFQAYLTFSDKSGKSLEVRPLLEVSEWISYATFKGSVLLDDSYTDATIAFLFHDENDVKKEKVGTVFAQVVGVNVEAASSVPEPSTLLLLGTGVVALAGLGRKKLRRR